jgi:hypothetical protein
VSWRTAWMRGRAASAPVAGRALRSWSGAGSSAGVPALGALPRGLGRGGWCVPGSGSRVGPPPEDVGVPPEGVGVDRLASGSRASSPSDAPSSRSSGCAGVHDAYGLGGARGESPRSWRKVGGAACRERGVAPG